MRKIFPIVGIIVIITSITLIAIFSMSLPMLDCAKYFDERIKSDPGHFTDMVQYTESRKQLIKEKTDIFFKNRCASTVNDWIYWVEFRDIAEMADWERQKSMEEQWHKDNT